MTIIIDGGAVERTDNRNAMAIIIGDGVVEKKTDNNRETRREPKSINARRTSTNTPLNRNTLTC